MHYDDLARADRLARLLEADMSDAEIKDLLRRASDVQPPVARDRMTLAEPASGDDEDDETDAAR